MISTSLSRVDGDGLLFLVRELMPGGQDLDLVEEACVELIGRMIRGDMMIGILPVEAEDVVVAGLDAVGRAGRPGAWLTLGRYQLREGDVDGALASLGAAADAGVGVLDFARATRWGTTDDKRRACALLRPLPDDDGSVTYQLGLVEAWLGDDEASVAHHHEAAAKGDADALFELSVLYDTGQQGVEIDADAAREWVIQAADLGQPRALYNVAARYATGNGVPRDTLAAARYYQQAAEAGHGRAAATLGVMHLTGEGVGPDTAAAANWFDTAEELGFDVDGWLDQLDLQRPAG